ncbi:merozoite surface protein 7 (MSP7) [Plasmodium vivax Brazil I]|uniref:Merozoite surface protein 7 (MSP7) n=1 Tax=Plasmodium vivax (strain Brazil I) TaxID=1033975 RepID=A0A0J9SR98_PLAV1|nr:merozoite surface protein 7 (MSP7) [Plasmodium vivax Brazil I]
MIERGCQVGKSLFDAFFEGNSNECCPSEFFKKVLNDAGLQKEFYSFVKLYNYLMGEGVENENLHDELLKNVSILLNRIEIKLASWTAILANAPF